MREVKRMKGNSIHIGALTFVNDKEENTILSSFKDVTYGCNINSTRKYFGVLRGKTKFDQVNLNKMKWNYIAITANKSDVIGNCKDVTCVPASYRGSSADKSNKRVRKGKDQEVNGSGIVLLFLCVMGNKNKGDISEVCWNDEAATKLKYSKNNILKSSKAKHFDSTGEYYSFGNKGNFGMVDNSSVGIYASKSYTKSSSNLKAKSIADEMESSSANEVGYAVKNLSGVVPNLHKLLSPVVDVAFNMQATHGDLNIQKVQTASSGLWQSKVCINATTKKWHTENDCSYTLVSVPNQDCVQEYVFFFRLNSSKYIGIPMKSRVSFVSSMKLLTHRQQCVANSNRQLNAPIIDGPGWQDRLQAGNQSVAEPDGNIATAQGNNFINVCSYVNRRLFTHIRASMQRNIAENGE